MKVRKTILVVDDNEVNRKILKKILSEEYDTIEAVSGLDALEQLKAHSRLISAVLLDLIMPEMDGFEFLEAQQKNPEISNIPVIVTTTQDNESSEIHALSLGATDFLSKPYRPSIIMHRLTNTIKLRENSALINSVEKDALTKIYNKDFFYKKAAEIIEHNKEILYDIICVDIEHFKLVNDLFGTDAGDHLLNYTAQRFQQRFGDTGICGRIGADVFAALTPHQDEYPDSWFQEANNDIKGYPLNIQLVLRFGIYQMEDRTLDISIMCDRAKLAIKSIKEKYGKFHSYYDDSLRKRLVDEQFIVDSMRASLGNREFIVYLQPKFNLTNNKIIGAEALVRWIHPERGFMSPGEFIPLFEKNGFITDLDMYVWEIACQYLQEWIQKGYQVVPVSVNVSRVDTYYPHLPEYLLDLVHKYGLTPELLHLEITESAYTDNPQQVIDVVAALKDMGFPIEMDDFGTGYSSLNMLSELPIDVLKLDMRFMQNKKNTTNNNNVISFIISLAKWLGLSVIAEGVEDMEQVETLRNMDCLYGQGYYYSKPIPKEEFEQILTTREIEQIQPSFILDVTNGRKPVLINLQPDIPAANPMGNASDQKPVMLIADDVEMNRVILREIFNQDYTIYEAANGAQAMDLLKNDHIHPDMLLLDLLMPVMDGFQVLEQLKSNPEYASIPVIVTSQAGEDSEAHALALGAADFISKPYHTGIVAARVRNVAASSVNAQTLYA